MSRHNPSATGRLRVVVLGYIVRGPMGGMSWHHLQYVLGLARLGHDVVFLEDSGDTPWCCYDPTQHARNDARSHGLAYAGRVFERVGLGERWAYHDAHRRSWHGPCAGRATRLCEAADLLLNLSCSNPLRPW